MTHGSNAGGSRVTETEPTALQVSVWRERVERIKRRRGKITDRLKALYAEAEELQELDMALMGREGDLESMIEHSGHD